MGAGYSIGPAIFVGGADLNEFIVGPMVKAALATLASNLLDIHE